MRQQKKVDISSIFIDNMSTQMANYYVGEGFAMSFQSKKHHEFKEYTALWHNLHRFQQRKPKQKYS